MTDFRNLMLQSESSGDYGSQITTEDGRKMTGGYMFSDGRLKDYKRATGEKFSTEDFKLDPDLQERVMDWHEGQIVDFIMDKGLDTYIGEEVAGVPIDIGAMLGIAHLGGNTGLQEFLETGGEYNPDDDFGTRLSDYAKKFYGANIYDTTPAAQRIQPQMRPADFMDTLSKQLREREKFGAAAPAGSLGSVNKGLLD